LVGTENGGRPGLYTGVEIASIAGEPRGLDWTGVFCLFSQGESADEADKALAESQKAEKSFGEASDASNKTDEASPAYTEALKHLSEQNVAKVLQLDTQLISIRHELEQKRRGFSLLAELQESLRQTTDYESILYTVTKRINAALNMQRTVVLSPDEDGFFVARMTQGYSAAEQKALKGTRIKLDDVFLDQNNPVLVTAADDDDYLAEFRETVGIPYFISAPIIVRDETVSLLVTGRLMEAIPFLSRLGRSEVETIQAAGALVATVMVYQRLDAADRKAQVDPLTGLLNHRAFENEVSSVLDQKRSGDYLHAFIMIDFDNFKLVNDNYGHLQGDVALKTLGNVLFNNFRSTDIISRLGGDEYGVFCPDIKKLEQVTGAIDRLNEVWRATSFVTDDGREFHATLSIGISLAPKDGVIYRDLYQKADIALYKSKQRGRDRYTLYDVKDFGDVYGKKNYR
jgi:diguanylate cyclase (GGDEF)-like protein